MNYRGWKIRLAKIEHSTLDALMAEFDGLPWADNLGRLIGIKIPADREGDWEFARFGNYICRQTREDMKLTQMLNECHAKHMMAQIQRSVA